MGCTTRPQPRRFAFILQADTDRHEGLARALHALLYAEDRGYEVLVL